jgi:hypothetical protein
MDGLHRCGFAVTRLSGSGVPDLLLSRRHYWHLAEVKLPVGPRGGVKGKKLLPSQIGFRDQHSAPVHVLRTLDDVATLAGAVP